MSGLQVQMYSITIAKGFKIGTEVMKLCFIQKTTTGLL